MTLKSLEVHDFRCLERCTVALDPHYNLFTGANGAGKTSVLEALYVLGRGRSFRCRRLAPLLREGQPAFLLVGRVGAPGPDLTLGVRGTRESTEIRIGGAPAASATALAGHFPPHILDPEVHKLLEEGPGRRRRFLDWGVFHVEPGFLGVWQHYHRALKQRNALLRAGGGLLGLAAWDAELLEAGLALTALRTRYLERLAPDLAALGEALVGSALSARYQPGWAAGTEFADALTASRARDQRYGLTHVGPHRAEVGVQVNGLAARDRVSRGEQKLVAAALTLAQLKVQERDSPGRAALLLDDPAAELDTERLERLVAAVRGIPVQLFVTSLRSDLPAFGQPGRRFHVEQGRVTEVA